MGRRGFLLTGLAACAAGWVSLARADQPPAAKLGKRAPPFDVADTAGRRHTLAGCKGKIVVLEWTSSSCPYAAAQYSSGRMPALQKWAIGKGVVWLSVLSTHPSRGDYLAPAQAEAFNRQRGGAPTALLIDASGDVGHTYGAMTADHTFVIAANGTLAYAGGIDDSESQDPKEVAASHNHVRAALDDLLAGRRVAKPSTDPFGCAVSYAG
ncbi:MAG TPA: redoxin domain-containing protein [Burkholderiaceae bacterium]|nr:redoxin domain-containing protein [Burkholderiaceae bacterium]